MSINVVDDNEAIVVRVVAIDGNIVVAWPKRFDGTSIGNVINGLLNGFRRFENEYSTAAKRLMQNALREEAMGLVARDLQRPWKALQGAIVSEKRSIIVRQNGLLQPPKGDEVLRAEIRQYVRSLPISQALDWALGADLRSLHALLEVRETPGLMGQLATSSAWSEIEKRYMRLAQAAKIEPSAPDQNATPDDQTPVGRDQNWIDRNVKLAFAAFENEKASIRSAESVLARAVDAIAALTGWSRHDTFEALTGNPS